MPTTAPEKSLYVWDAFVRLFHWSLVLLVTLNLFVLEEGDTAHEWSGYCACALIVLRIGWGFIGSHYARFSEFWPTPSKVKTELCGLLQRRHQSRVGHSPLGALMMLALVLNIVLLGVTGFGMGTDAFFGEEWLQNLHADLATSLQILMGLHVLAALVVGRLERVNLIAAMITGYKRFK